MKPWSQGRDRYRDFFYTSLNVETETETINFETETETQMEVVETIKDETREICSKLQFSKLSRPRLSETMESLAVLYCNTILKCVHCSCVGISDRVTKEIEIRVVSN